MTWLPRLSSSQVLALRPEISRPAPGNSPLAVFEEIEPANVDGDAARVLTVLLRGSECAFRCVMCDLWKSTHQEATAAGAIAEQVRVGVGDWIGQGFPGPRWIKLYNASNFFAPSNVPTVDQSAIACQVASADRIIVENHPRLLTDAIEKFRDAIAGKLEVAMGLETIHPHILPALNKQMNLEDFQRACGWLLERNIDVRAFVLLRPPGLSESEGVDWCQRSIDFARRQGVRHVSVIPVRGGNGAIEHLQQAGYFTPPSAASLEWVLERQIRQSAMIVSADLWDWHKLRGTCESCRDRRKSRLESMNRSQQPSPPIICGAHPQ